VRTTFTYKNPRPPRRRNPGRLPRPLPFRKKSTVGVVTEFIDAPPVGTKLREIQKSLDVVPALKCQTPRARPNGNRPPTMSRTIGEVYRAMLPPLTELHPASASSSLKLVTPPG
jgi:hypothetical protein